MSTTGGDQLVWWRRRSGTTFPTGGIFEASEGSAPALPAKAAGNFLDPGVAQFFPVAGKSPDGQLHMIGIVEFDAIRKPWEGCGRGKGIQLMHVVIEHAAAARAATYRCTNYSVGPVSDYGAGDSVRGYIHIAPLAQFAGDRILVRLYRRFGEGALPWNNAFRSLDALISAKDEGAHSDSLNFVPASGRCWTVPDTAEPFFTLGQHGTAIVGFSYMQANKVVEADTHPSADLRMLLFTADAGTCQDRPANLVRFRTRAKDFFQSRAFHVRLEKSTAAARSAAGNTDFVIATRFSAVPEGKRFAPEVSLLVIRFAETKLRGCDLIRLDRLPDTYGTAAEARARGMRLEPIGANLNGDGVPDIVLADSTDSARSLGYIGTATTEGGLSFMANGRLARSERGNACVF